MDANWQSQVANAFRNTRELLEFLDLSPEQVSLTDTPFPFLVTRAFADRMIKSDPQDPLLLQVLPKAEELDFRAGFGPDPVSDLDAQRSPGLLQKYQHRALVISTGACAIHCRYCFRRDFPYQEQQTTRSRWEATIDEIRSDSTLEEVILSGGDPLMLSNERLREIFQDLSAIPHLDRIRIHTRMPIVLPERIDDGFIELMEKCTLRVIVVIHSNHPNELDSSVASAMDRMFKTGATLLNQSVLLRSINDSEPTLIALSKKLFEMKVIPYYLHSLDHATGTAHFEVTLQEAKDLANRLRAALPGYLVPRLVQEIPGRDSKTPIL
jgi:EF-P beta-lysylation protein EpmB